MKVKVVFVGPTNAGKTSLINRFVYSDFSYHCMPSAQPAFRQKTIKLDSSEIQLEIWDTAGQERYHSLSPLFYRDADIGIVTFDLTDVDSFNTAKEWIQELHNNRGDGIMIGIACNKKDLVAERSISFQTIHKFAQDNDILAVETSAQSGENVNFLFECLANKFLASGKAPSKVTDERLEESGGCDC